jgi:protein-L-isoaspartate(D-aspartate) O-methyltransferase
MLMPNNSRIQERLRMVETQISTRGIRDPRVIGAMLAVPRHLFVPPDLAGAAYQDRPLPIGHGQTISQPYIVALMTELLMLTPGDRVLEIGTGSGYQAAVLANIAAEVISIERIEAVASRARAVLADQNVTRVSVVVGDGTEGYPPGAPYDAIIITASTPEIPPPLIEQLADNGRLVAPAGGREVQELIRLIRHGDRIDRESFGGVIFVPLIGRFGWQQ